MAPPNRPLSVFIRLELALLACAPGCSFVSKDFVETSVEPTVLPSATVATAFDIPGTKALWRVDPARPLVVVTLGTARVERTRAGGATLVLSGHPPIALPRAANPPDAPAVEETRGIEDDPFLSALLASAVLPKFTAEPVAAVPDALAALLRDPAAPSCDEAAALARHLLRGERVPFTGTVSPRGHITGWLTLTPAGRDNLSAALPPD